MGGRWGGWGCGGGGVGCKALVDGPLRQNFFLRLSLVVGPLVEELLYCGFPKLHCILNNSTATKTRHLVVDPHDDLALVSGLVRGLHVLQLQRVGRAGGVISKTNCL